MWRDRDVVYHFYKIPFYIKANQSAEWELCRYVKDFLCPIEERFNNIGLALGNTVSHRIVHLQNKPSHDSY